MVDNRPAAPSVCSFGAPQRPPSLAQKIHLPSPPHGTFPQGIGAARADESSQMVNREWKLGERLMHGGRPEWGIGEIRSAESLMHNGSKCQRLTVRFERAGVKTLSTAFADLRPADQMPSLVEQPVTETANNGKSERGWLSEVEQGSIVDQMTKLPDDATDPFRTRKARFEASLNLYRFTPTGASLLDWASIQSGLKDPLSKFSRHELERLFDRFRANLDGHLKKLGAELKKEDQASMAALVEAAPPAAKQAVKRLDIGR